MKVDANLGDTGGRSNGGHALGEDRTPPDDSDDVQHMSITVRVDEYRALVEKVGQTRWKRPQRWM